MAREVEELVDEGRGGDEKSRQGQKKWRRVVARSIEVAELIDEGRIGTGEVKEGFWV